MISEIIQYLINGAMMGSIYALIALGLSIIYGVMNIVNFAHGEFVMVAMYTTYFLVTLLGLDPVFTPLLTFPLLFGIGVLLYYLVIGPTLGRLYVTQLAVTVGLMIFLRALAQILWKARPRSIGYSIVQGNIEIGLFNIMTTRGFSAIVSILVIGLVYLFLQKTWAGRKMRATADDPAGVSLAGSNPWKIYALTFGLGSALTAIAGGLLMTFQPVDPSMGIRFGLLSWCIMALAGLGSLPGLLISGILVGCVESLVMAFWDPRGRSLAVYLIFVLVLWLKPEGLFPKKV